MNTNDQTTAMTVTEAAQLAQQQVVNILLDDPDLIKNNDSSQKEDNDRDTLLKRKEKDEKTPARATRSVTPGAQTITNGDDEIALRKTTLEAAASAAQQDVINLLLDDDPEDLHTNEPTTKAGLKKDYSSMQSSHSSSSSGQGSETRIAVGHLAEDDDDNGSSMEKHEVEEKIREKEAAMLAQKKGVFTTDPNFLHLGSSSNSAPPPTTTLTQLQRGENVARSSWNTTPGAIAVSTSFSGGTGSEDFRAQSSGHLTPLPTTASTAALLESGVRPLLATTSRPTEDSTHNQQNHHHHGLVQAHPIVEEEQAPNLQHADPVHNANQSNGSTDSVNKKNKWSSLPNDENPHKKEQWKILAALAVVLLIGGIVLAIVFTTASDDNDDSNASESSSAAEEQDTLTSMAPTPSPTISLSDWMGLPEWTLTALENPVSPQAQAYEWLASDPFWNDNRNDSSVFVKEKAIQRFAMATFFFATKGPDEWDLNHHWLDDYPDGDNDDDVRDECYWFNREPIDSENQWAYRRQLQQREERQFLRQRHLLDVTIIATENTTNATTTPYSACNDQGQLERIILSGNNLQGSLPPEIGLLSKLQLLDISGNEFLAGPLPSELGLLTDLQRLAADRNGHTGGIPSEMGLLPNITTIYLEHNPFGGSIPTELGNLGASLTSLTLQRSGLTGYLPTELYRLTLLKELHVQNILQLTGGTLEGIGALTNLESFLAHDVPFNSTIPAEVGLLTNLHSFNLWNTKIYGTFPPEFWQNTKMVNMDIDDNFLSGTFPGEMGRFSHLESVWINGNQLSGTFPSNMWGNLKNLTYLNMRGNKISGTIPTEVGLMTSMQKVWFAEMALSGTIPSEIANMEALNSIFFHMTELEGTIPTEFQNLENLEMITLSNTSVTGEIPDNLCDSLKDMVISCLVVLGVQEQICTEVEEKNFTCSSSNLCGCDCEPCV